MHYLSEGQFTLHNFCPNPAGFHIFVTVVKIESRSFSTAELIPIERRTGSSRLFGGTKNKQYAKYAI